MEEYMGKRYFDLLKPFGFEPISLALDHFSSSFNYLIYVSCFIECTVTTMTESMTFNIRR